MNKYLPHGEKIMKIGLTDPQIIGLHQNFTRYSGISGAIKSCIYKELVHSVSVFHSNEWRWSIL